MVLLEVSFKREFISSLTWDSFCLFYEGESKAAAISTKLNYQNQLLRNGGFFISCSLLIKNRFFFFLKALLSLDTNSKTPHRVSGQNCMVCIKKELTASDLVVPSELKIY